MFTIIKSTINFFIDNRRRALWRDSAEREFMQDFNTFCIQKGYKQNFCGITNVHVKTSAHNRHVTIACIHPGLLIGKSGSTLEELKLFLTSTNIVYTIRVKESLLYI